MKKFYLIFFIVVSLSGTYAQQWVEQVQPSPQRLLRSASAVNSNVAWACGDFGTVLYTSNGGANWLHRGGGPLGSNNVYAITGIDSMSALCAVNSATYGYIFRTSNAGINWMMVYSKSGGFINGIKLISFAASSFFAYGNPIGGRWLLLRSTNGGFTFDTSGLRLNQSGSEMSWPNAMDVIGNNIWFGTNNSRIYRTTNGGIIWFASTLAGQNIYAITFNGTTGFAAGDLAYRSTNSGVSWVIQLNLPGTGVFNAAANLGSAFWYGRGTEIYFSSNEGVNYNLQYTSPSAGTYNQLSFFYSAGNNILTTVRGWGVTNNGAISHYSDPIGIINISNKVPGKFRLYQNYPNPFNPVTNIRFDVPSNVKGEKSNVKIVVYDIQGKEIAVLVEANLIAGTYEYSWDGSMYSSGVYFYKLISDGFSGIGKMLLVK
jgi:photosystem II stability/assembly factor-like uncharacterized protein